MKYSRSLVATLLMSGGLLQLAPLALAAGTAANQTIDNTATATYEDPAAPGVNINTTSNTVKVTVAEVAGITITAKPTVVNTGATLLTTGATPTSAGAAPLAGDNLVFEFDVTNVGNDTTSFHIPNQVQKTGPISVSVVQYFNKVTGNWETVDSASNTIATNSNNGGPILPTGDPTNPANLNNINSVVKVRVLATVNAGTTTGLIGVTLGNTGQTNLQNVPFDSSGGDVYTVDNDGTPGDIAGVPSNGNLGVQEAAATANTAVNAEKQAFVKIKKTAGVVDTKSTTPVTDDQVTYNLSLDVASTSPVATKAAEDLAGTPINLKVGSAAATTVNRILISDAIPVGAEIVSASVTDSSWTVVYSITPIGTTTANDPSVEWTTVAPTTLSTVTRVGYIKSGTVAKGDSVTGFALTIKLGLPATGGSVLNIAQAFGATSTDAIGTPDLTKPAVDESGDDQYDNLNSDGSNGPTPSNGLATAATGVDTAGTNIGSGPGGEATIVTLTPAGQTGGLTNGPENKPDAVGPVGTNDDFTNKSVNIDTAQAAWDANGPKALLTSPSTSFTNTVKSTGGTKPQFVSLLPTVPSNPADLPSGTTVKIIGPSGAFVLYTYNGTAFTTIGTPTPVTLTVPVGGSVDYGVEIKLPIGTPQIKGFPVPITAFANGAPAVAANPTTGTAAIAAVVGDNTIDPTDAQNITIDRIYTGYVKLVKEAEVFTLNANGTRNILSSFATATGKKAEPGQYIEYRIKYSNISEASTGSPTVPGSVGLSANNLKIVENGATGGNTWGSNTQHKPASAEDSLGGSLLFENNAKTNGDLVVADYSDTLNTLAPAAFGEFKFTRQVK
jgi:hypothetical protein